MSSRRSSPRQRWAWGSTRVTSRSACTSGCPPTPVAYYQQVGRAGRAVDRAEVIALPRPTEDAAVWRWFESVSLPSEEICRSVIDLLDRDRPTSIVALEPDVNLGRSRLGILLSILEVDGAITRAGNGYVRTDEHWVYDHELVRRAPRAATA